MKNTKKIVSRVLAICMLASLAIITQRTRHTIKQYSPELKIAV